MEPSKEALLEFWRICQETDHPIRQAIAAAEAIDFAALVHQLTEKEEECRDLKEVAQFEGNLSQQYKAENAALKKQIEELNQEIWELNSRT